jgi:hypothetical protein
VQSNTRAAEEIMTTAPRYVFEILTHEEGRFIVRVNDIEIDILADEDGVSAELLQYTDEQDSPVRIGNVESTNLH